MFVDCRTYGGSCGCSREHYMETKGAIIEQGCLLEFERHMADFGISGKRCALYGENSYTAAEGRRPRAEQEIVLDPRGLQADQRSTTHVL